MYKRKTFIINKEFQYGFIATFLVIVIISLIIFSGGFFLYYWLRDTVGEWKYDEFIDIKQEFTIKVQPINANNIVDPYALAVKLQDNQAPMSKYIQANISGQALLLINSFDEQTDSYEIQRVISQALTQFLKYLITQNKDLTKTGITISPELQELIDKNPDIQSAERYRLNLMIIVDAYKDELQITISDDPNELEELQIQKIQSSRKRYEIVFPTLLMNNLIIMILIMVIGIFYSHRMAGPIYRMEQDIKKVLAGEKDLRIKVRKKDKFKELAELINKLIQKLK